MEALIVRGSAHVAANSSPSPVLFSGAGEILVPWLLYKRLCTMCLLYGSNHAKVVLTRNSIND